MIKNVEEIIVKEGRRPIDQDEVVKLAHSIKELGLLQPILINKENVLIAGNHRLEACKYLGWTEIDCTISDLEGPEVELAEIDENLIRNELHFTERGECLIRRKHIFEHLHPEAKAKVAGAIASNAVQGKNHASEFNSFASDTAAKTGISERVIQNEIQIVEKLVPEAQEAVKIKNLTKSQALELTRKSPEEQKEIVAQVADEEPAEAKKTLTQLLLNYKHFKKEQDSCKINKIKALEVQLMEKYEEYKTAFAELGDDTGDYQPLILQRQMASDEGKSLMDPTLEEIETVSSGNVTEPEVPGKTFDNGVLLETATEGLKSEDNNSNNIRKPLFLTVTSNPGPTAKKLVYRKSPRTLPAEA